MKNLVAFGGHIGCPRYGKALNPAHGPKHPVLRKAAQKGTDTHHQARKPKDQCQAKVTDAKGGAQ